jgi:hypothetical protein
MRDGFRSAKPGSGPECSQREAIAMKPESIRVENINTPGRSSSIDAGKYLAMRRVLLKVLPERRPGMTQVEMAQAVVPHLPQDLWPGGAKAMWWLKTVQLDLEAKGLIERDRAARPLRWNRC